MLLTTIAKAIIFMSFFVCFSVTPNTNQVDNGEQKGSEVCQSNNVFESLPQCQPRETLIPLELPSPNEGNRVVIDVIPSHVLVSRCTGVCYEGAAFHKCGPANNADATSKKSFQVLYQTVSNSANFGGVFICNLIQVEVHNSCECGCHVNSSDCNALKDYDAKRCQCVCKNLKAKGLCLSDTRRKVWSEDNCRCLCKPEEYKECSTGYVYDTKETCECKIDDSTFLRMSGVAIWVPLLVLLVVLLAGFIFIYFKWRRAEHWNKIAKEDEVARSRKLNKDKSQKFNFKKRNPDGIDLEEGQSAGAMMHSEVGPETDEDSVGVFRWPEPSSVQNLNDLTKESS